MMIVIKARVILDDSLKEIQIPVLLHNGILVESVFNYFIEHINSRGRSWREINIRAIKLFYDYCTCNSALSEEEIFKNFTIALVKGTSHNGGVRVDELHWKPRTRKNANNILKCLDRFFEWEANHNSSDRLPLFSRSHYDLYLEKKSLYYHNQKSFLGHCWKITNYTKEHSYFPSKSGPLDIGQTEPPFFKDDDFIRLITDGFKKNNKYDYRNILITLLLNGAGFRVSEPFHLYVVDVFQSPLDSTLPMVLIHHPVYGTVCDDQSANQKCIKRIDYLHQNYCLQPRNMLTGKKFAGWKGGFHDGQCYKRAYWFPADYGRLFFKIWILYLEQIIGFERNHPYAFINLFRDPKGDMYTISQYIKSHANACKKIGLIPAKEFGTTPHGHRHAYAKRLVAGGINKNMIKRFMHHSSIDSQEVYTQPTSSEIAKELENAELRLKDKTKNNSQTMLNIFG